MKVEQEVWTVEDLVSEKAQIQVSPAWQRGPAWTTSRQVLLIDSILRGLDIPKVYLRVCKKPNAYSYDAVDGQQRLRSIWLFHDGKLALKYSEGLDLIDEFDVNGLTFEKLPVKLKNRFNKFIICVAKIVESDQLEISRLFARLQQGVPLNPAELRNAMLGPIRNQVEAIALSHSFFQDGRIADARYRRQDYVAHIFALAANGISHDIKAQNLKNLYHQFSANDTNEVMSVAAEVDAALTILNDVNSKLGYIIRHKWLVIDFTWLIIQRIRSKVKIDPVIMANKFKVFDDFRRVHTSAPEGALESTELSSELGKSLYQYLVAFKLQGGTKVSVEIRSTSLSAFID